MRTSATTTAQRVAPDDLEASTGDSPGAALVLYLVLGFFFGVILIKGEIVSWFRIQEMFRFDSFHMYGIMGSGVAVAAISLYLIRRSGLTTLGGEPIEIPRKELGSGRRYIFGGLAFGAGWAITGACPGPLLALIGYGLTPMIVVLASALLGTWSYGQLRSHLPH